MMNYIFNKILAIFFILSFVHIYADDNKNVLSTESAYQRVYSSDAEILKNKEALRLNEQSYYFDYLVLGLVKSPLLPQRLIDHSREYDREFHKIKSLGIDVHFRLHESLSKQGVKLSQNAMIFNPGSAGTFLKVRQALEILSKNKKNFSFNNIEFVIVPYSCERITALNRRISTELIVNGATKTKLFYVNPCCDYDSFFAGLHGRTLFTNDVVKALASETVISSSNLAEAEEDVSDDKSHHIEITIDGVNVKELLKRAPQERTPNSKNSKPPKGVNPH